jgi:hypothetical protein
VSPVKYGLGFYIPEDDILHSHRSEKLRYLSVFRRNYSFRPQYRRLSDARNFKNIFAAGFMLVVCLAYSLCFQMAAPVSFHMLS